MSRQQGSDRRLTKAERKEQARIEREEIQRRRASRSRNRILLIVVGIALAALVTGAIAWTGGNEPTTPPGAVTLPDPATLEGILRTPPPWPPNTEDLESRLAELKLPALNDQPGALHHHIQLFISVDGQPVDVPANIGLSQQASSPLHTHENEPGLIHVESADPNFQPVLGQFMDVWGPYMTATCLGAECNKGDRQLRVFVNGDEYTGDPTLLPLTDLLVVVVTFGTKDQLPDPMPDASAFPTV